MDTTTEILTAVFLSAIALGFVVAMIASAIKWPVYWLLSLALLVLVASFARADGLRLELSVVLDDVGDRAAADEAVRQAADILRTQLGTELVATVVEVNNVALHTKAEALLDAVKLHRIDTLSLRATDVTVFLTRRELTRGYEGIATIGPACSASASAIVRLRADGLDGQIMAHEILHTVGVPHDGALGWLMSESLSRTGSGNLSPDSAQTFKAAPLDCMVTIEPRAVSSGAGVPSSQTVAGGGGSFEAWFILVLAALCVFVLERRNNKQKAAITELKACVQRYEADRPSDFTLTNVRSVKMIDAQDISRVVTINFHSYAGMGDFHNWLNRQIVNARLRAS